MPSVLFATTSLIIFWISHKEYGYILNLFSSNLFTLALGGILFGANLLPILFENRTELIKVVKTKLLKPKPE